MSARSFGSAAEGCGFTYLAAHAWTILRFWNGDVLDNLEGVYAAILAAVAQAATHPRPLPSREGGITLPIPASASAPPRRYRGPDRAIPRSCAPRG
ncbi:DUF559 domain-containing protein [uncultured Sphingomonas sp.]|uniref:DUF559 domain-containing protein n=1 Tax=uncultured Sphingomonas sp. TaxID=158754 RepID=UPI0025ED0AA5|nr:DUF559 domain-containing protein [uncultured Sphingomonas sp.]